MRKSMAASHGGGEKENLRPVPTHNADNVAVSGVLRTGAGGGIGRFKRRKGTGSSLFRPSYYFPRTSCCWLFPLRLGKFLWERGGWGRSTTVFFFPFFSFGRSGELADGWRMAGEMVFCRMSILFPDLRAPPPSVYKPSGAQFPRDCRVGVWGSFADFFATVENTNCS